MLEKLAEIDWKKLKHAYGSAKDVPAKIKKLASSNQKVREKALYDFYGNIFHQGTRYTATPFVVPFLYELLESDKVEDKPNIISLLVNLALGYEEAYLPNGLNVEEFRKELLEREANMTEDDRADCEEYGMSPLTDLECYEAVKAGVPTLLNCLKSDNPETTNKAAYALAWFPELADVSAPALFYLLDNLEEEEEIGNTIVAIGLLARQSKTTVDISPIKNYLNSSSQITKVSAALALANNPLDKAVLDILIEVLQSEDEELEGIEDIFFNDGNIAGYVSTTLAEYGKSEKEKVVPALCHAMKSVGAYQSMDITNSLLELINGERTTPIKFEEKENLSALELEALHTIYKYGGWKLGATTFANYSELLSSAGIPSNQKDLGKFLGVSTYKL